MLMDKYKNYDTFRTPTTVLRLGKKESALLRPYFQAELDRAIATYEKKYKYKLPAPVQLKFIRITPISKSARWECRVWAHPWRNLRFRRRNGFAGLPNARIVSLGQHSMA